MLDEALRLEHLLEDLGFEKGLRRVASQDLGPSLSCFCQDPSCHGRVLRYHRLR